MADPSTDNVFEREKWEEEKRRQDRDFDLRERELKAKLADQKVARWLNPLAAAIIAAILAGGANVWVEQTREADAHKLEIEKAEAARISGVIGTVSPNQASQNLKFLADLLLISDEALRRRIIDYVHTRGGGEGAGNVAEPPAVAATKPPEPSSESKQNTVQYQSGWVSGGHNQNEMCQKGMVALQPKFLGKTLTVLNSDEQFRKDFLGHVEYNYSCVFQIN